MKYASFTHNFETCLEKDNPYNSRRLQLLIQHFLGIFIESCVNLPVDEGYYLAGKDLRKNIIAIAHIRKLENLRPLKPENEASLPEFSRHLDVDNRILAGIGSEHVNDLNYASTLRELNKKLPLFLRIK